MNNSDINLQAVIDQLLNENELLRRRLFDSRPRIFSNFISWIKAIDIDYENILKIYIISLFVLYVIIPLIEYIWRFFRER